jgi:kinesin family protein 2/24
MDQTLLAITNLARERDERRKNAEAAKRRKAFEAKEQIANGKFGDVEFVSMIEHYRNNQAGNIQPHVVNYDAKIQVVVRKRPSSDRERQLLDHDAVTCFNPVAVVHNCKFKVDGITKILENFSFEFDHVFDEFSTNKEIFDSTCKPLVEFVVLEDGRGTVFAYGQTGSGKTFTMEGITAYVAQTLFSLIESSKMNHTNNGNSNTSKSSKNNNNNSNSIRARCSMFELYGGNCLDLLNERRICAVREDGHGDVHIEGLKDIEVYNEEQFITVLQEGSLQRTTRSTEMNTDSSRSHAIFNVTLSSGGKLSLIDLAGSERGQDTKNHDATRRNESAAINKSLLALKECIRALDPSSGATRIPYRGSKLTMVLKDAFATHSKTVMISCVSPAASSSDHTLNTLRYADRIKEKVVGGNTTNSNNNNLKSSPKSPIGIDSSSVPVVGGGGGGKKPLAFVGAPTTNTNHNRSKSPGQFLARATSAPVPSTSTGKNSSSSAAAARNNVNINRNNNVFMIPSTYSSSSLRESSSFIGNSNASNNHNILPTTEYSAENISSSADDEDDDDNLSPEHIEILRQAAARKESLGGTTTTNNTNTANNIPHEAVQSLIDEEERVLAAHLDAVQKNARILAREGELLEMVQGTVDYDIEQYAKELESLLDEKIEILQRLRFKVTTFRQNLALEEDVQCL